MQGAIPIDEYESITWYADNSELNGIKGAEIPDIHLFGGIIVDQSAEFLLRTEIEDIKEKYSGHRRAPIKWNFRDLKRLYKNHHLSDIYELLLESSKEWRLRVFESLSKFDITLIVACIEGYSTKRSTLKSVKNELTRYIFSNALMHLGLYVRETKPRDVRVVLDWPDKGNTTPFDLEYEHAFIQGQTFEHNIPYQCGNLEDLKFSDSVRFANAQCTTMLQVADMVVGATREFIQYCLGKKGIGQGVECLRKVWQKFLGAPNNVIGRGLIISPGNSELMSRMKDCIGTLSGFPSDLST